MFPDAPNEVLQRIAKFRKDNEFRRQRTGKLPCKVIEKAYILTVPLYLRARIEEHPQHLPQFHPLPILALSPQFFRQAFQATQSGDLCFQL